MKIEIEDYKGQTIYYDEELDKFICDISIEDTSKSTKRQSLIMIRKEVDQFIKENLAFKPFKFLQKRYGSTYFLYTAIGIRSNGTLIISEKGYKHNSFWGKKEMEGAKMYSQSYETELDALDTQEDHLKKRNDKIREELASKLEDLHLKYDLK